MLVDLVNLKTQIHMYDIYYLLKAYHANTFILE